MKVLRLIVTALVVIAIARDALAAEAPTLVLPPAQADAATLATIVRQSGVERDIPKPGWAEYVPVIVTAVMRRMWDQLRPLRSLFNVPAGVAGIVATCFVGLVVIAGLLLALRLLVHRRRARTVPPLASAESGPPAPLSIGAAEWRRELDRRLESGDVSASLEALWWFLARSVSSEEVLPSVTSGELLARARRHELRPFAVQLDRFRYGPRDPRPSDVRDLVVRLEEALA